MAVEADRAHARLAELVAALSLGIDLGFGQPMEHVLRQCLIALRLAERMGLDEDERAVVYYTALLINVGCHTDAHEQAKWFADDIAAKSVKYDYELRSFRDGGQRPAEDGRGQPAAAPLPHGPRVRHLGPPRGGRDDRAPRRRRAHAGRAARAAGGGARRPRLGLRDVGRQGLAGRVGGRADPAGGPVGGAGRVRRGRPPRRRGGSRDRAGAQAQRQAVRPGRRGVPVRGPRGDPRRPRRRRHLARRDRRRARPRRRALGRAVRRGPDRDRELRRSQVALHARACARRG